MVNNGPDRCGKGMNACKCGLKKVKDVVRQYERINCGEVGRDWNIEYVRVNLRSCVGRPFDNPGWANIDALSARTPVMIRVPGFWTCLNQWNQGKDDLFFENMLYGALENNSRHVVRFGKHRE